MISARKKKKEGHAQNAKGVLAYLKSFREVYGENNFVSRNIEPLEQSLNAITHSESKDLQLKQIFWTALYIIPTTLLFAFMSLRAPADLPSGYINNVSSSQIYIYDKLSQIGGVGQGAVVVFVGFIYLQMTAAYNIKEWQIFREFKRFIILRYVTKSSLLSASILPFFIGAIFTFIGAFFILLGLGIDLIEMLKSIFAKLRPIE